MPTDRAPEHEAFLAALPAVAPLLQPLRPALGGSLLGRLLSDTPFLGEEVAPRFLPKEAREALREGHVVASVDADVWIFVVKPDGEVRVCHAHPESFRVLGESIAEWLGHEITRVEAARTKKGPKPPSGKPVIDQVVARLVALSEGRDVRGRLEGLALSRQNTLWKYLLHALAAAEPRWSPALLGAVEGRLLGRLLGGKLHDTDDETCKVEEGDDDLDGINPVYVGRYPAIARDRVRDVKPTEFVASSGPEIWFLLRENTQKSPSTWKLSVHHASWDGYELLGVSLEAWLLAELERVERALS